MSRVDAVASSRQKPELGQATNERFENRQKINFNFFQFVAQRHDDFFDTPLESVRHDVWRLFISQLDVRDLKVLQNQTDRIQVRARSGRQSHDSKY